MIPNRTHRDKDIVHWEHIVHVLQVNVELDNLLQGRSGELKDLFQGSDGLDL